VKEKTFDATNGALPGDRKSAVARKIRQPDAKRVFNGHEIWEYEQVRLGNGGGDTFTIFLEFQADTVVSSAGN
jgi:hypothetical protein